jgi:hypothetical protein
MNRALDPRICNVMLDANVLDYKGGPADAVVDELLALHGSGKVTLALRYSVQAEINRPETPADVKERATGLLFSLHVELTEPERALHQQVRTILQGKAKAGQHDRDAFHIVEVLKIWCLFHHKRRSTAKEAV